MDEGTVGRDVGADAEDAVVAVEEDEVERVTHADGVDGIAMFNEECVAFGWRGMEEEAAKTLGECDCTRKGKGQHGGSVGFVGVECEGVRELHGAIGKIRTGGRGAREAATAGSPAG